MEQGTIGYPCREKFWGELDDGERIVRLRGRVKKLEARVKELRELVAQLRRHQHGADGAPVVTIELPTGNEQDYPPFADDVYF